MQEGLRWQVRDAWSMVRWLGHPQALTGYRSHIPCRNGSLRRLSWWTINYWLATFPVAVCLTVFGAIGLHACSASACWSCVDATCCMAMLIVGLSHTLLVTTLVTFASVFRHRHSYAIAPGDMCTWLCYSAAIVATCIVLPAALSAIGMMALDACANRVCWNGLGNDWALALLLMGQFYIVIYGLTEASTMFLMPPPSEFIEARLMLKRDLRI